MSDLPDPGTIAVLGTMLIPIVAIISCYWHHVRKAELEAAIRQAEIELKRELVQKGMSADEIARVVGSHTSDPTRAPRYQQQMQSQ